MSPNPLFRCETSLSTTSGSFLARVFCRRTSLTLLHQENSGSSVVLGPDCAAFTESPDCYCVAVCMAMFMAMNIDRAPVTESMAARQGPGQR